MGHHGFGGHHGGFGGHHGHHGHHGGFGGHHGHHGHHGRHHGHHGGCMISAVSIILAGIMIVGTLVSGLISIFN